MKQINTILLFVFLLTFPLFSATDSFSNTFSDYADLPVLNVVPPAYAGTPGTASFTGPLASTPRTYQLLINANQLTALVGMSLNAITFRLPVAGTGNWPASDAACTDYDIYLSGSVDPANRSFTFAENVVGPQKQVRSGPLTIPANSFTTGNSPNEFGIDIEFDSTYLYTGGNLLIEIRHTEISSTSRSVDAIGTSISGYGTDFSACWASGYTATTNGLQGNFSVTRINSELIVGISNNTELPQKFNLNQNFPNPFNPVTSIDFELPFTGNTELTVFDINGKTVDVLINGSKPAGKYSVSFNAANLPSGVYLYKLKTESGGRSFEAVKKMTLVK
ncbi:MAG TPA: T9SS type A sorting domain-containing protein [Ignavibacteria bacterium]|nr:T9SS type A sorting domain-containing protein [Ignavibacteria bacterium]